MTEFAFCNRSCLPAPNEYNVAVTSYSSRVPAAMRGVLFVNKNNMVIVCLDRKSFIMLLKCFCVIYCFVTLNIAVVISDINTLHEFGSLKAALQYDRHLLESEVAKRPHLIMFYAPWYDCLVVS